MFSRFDTIRERDGQTPPDGIAALCSLVAVARQKSSAQNFSSKQIILDLQFFCGLQIERRPTDLQILWIWIDMRIVLHTILQPQNHWLAVTNERARNVHKPWRTCLHVSCCCSHVVAAIRCYDRFSQCVGGRPCYDIDLQRYASRGVEGQDRGSINPHPVLAQVL